MQRRIDWQKKKQVDGAREKKTRKRKNEKIGGKILRCCLPIFIRIMDIFSFRFCFFILCVIVYGIYECHEIQLLLCALSVGSLRNMTRRFDARNGPESTSCIMILIASPSNDVCRFGASKSSKAGG